MTGGSTSSTSANIADMLAAWLPRQRWFPGRGTAVSDLAVVSDVMLASGDPAQSKPAHSEPTLRHLIVEASLPHGTGRFQVLVASRADLPPSLADAVMGELDGATYYDALHDPELAAVLLSGIARERTAGQLRFVREPTAQIGSWPESRRLTAEQSNTSLIFSERAILKVLRRLFPGANPDLEVADALARLGSARVAVPYGWIETQLDGEPVLLAVLSEYLAKATDGWDLARAGVRRRIDLAEGDGDEPDPEHDFTRQARALGTATAELHADMAKAFGTRTMTRADLKGLADDLSGKLADAIEVVPQLRRHAERLESAFVAVGELRDPVAVQRIHGDYHLGQVMFGQHGWVALDFEGEPGVPLAKRRAAAPPLRDVAGMLRSFDYAARHELAGRPHEQLNPGGTTPRNPPQLHPGGLHPGGTTPRNPPQLHPGGTTPRNEAAGAWVRSCQAEFCAGYAEAGGADPDDHAKLLRALTLEKAIYEVIYEHRHRPSWVSIPLDFLATA